MQFDLWQPVTKIKKHEELMKTCDTIQNKFGNKSLFYAREGTEQLWKAKSNNRSPNYTTRWEEIPSAKTSSDM